MGEWIIGAIINLCGSVAINFGTNLLKLGHIEREQLSVFDHDGTESKPVQKPIIYFQTWRVGILFFALGNCLNFVSFGYAAQSLLAALGSVQFVSNIAFTYFVLKKKVTGKVLIATVVIVFGNVFLVAFGNHQSPVFTPEQLEEKYSNLVFIFYCILLAIVVAANQYTYGKGEVLLSSSGSSIGPYWHMLLPLSYAIVSGAVGSCSVLFAKSLSNLLRLTMESHYQLHSWFTYSLLLLFLGTAGFWMARLNEGLALFDAILIVPMFQIAWTFFSICTGIVYFQEYQVFDMLRTTMFILGMVFVFAGISLLAPEDSKGVDAKDSQSSPSASSKSIPDWSRPEKSQIEGPEIKYGASFLHSMVTRMADVGGKLKTACTVSLGLSEDTMSASSVLAMPMVSSRMTGFRGTAVDRAKLFQLQSPKWSLVSSDEDEDDPSVTEAGLLLSQNHV